jgi:hypothetical protein
MRKFICLIAVAAILCPMCLSAQGVDSLIMRLKSVERYNAGADFRLLMSLQDDVAYEVDLCSATTPADSLSPCSYLIRWRSDGAQSGGFSAYFDGALYTFRGERLVERHFVADSTSFLPHDGAPAVQRSVQFANLLPQFIAEDMTEIVSSPDYTWHFCADTLVAERRCMAFSARMEVGGATSRELLYAFDRESAMPHYITIDNNPGALAEQTIEVTYHEPDAPTACVQLNEKALAEMYPDVFERYRESTFAIENLPGQPLPRFSLPTLTGERYTYDGTAQGFRQPTLVVLFEPESVFACATIDGVRRAVAQLPYNADVLWAAVSNDRDCIDALLPADRLGETTLVSAKGLARDCGTALFPVVIAVESNGIVADVLVGYRDTLVADTVAMCFVLK